jgi:hypothetical protein
MLTLGAATTNTSMADMDRFLSHAAPNAPSYSRAQLAIAMAARASGSRPHPGVGVVLSAIADEITD